MSEVPFSRSNLVMVLPVSRLLPARRSSAAGRISRMLYIEEIFPSNDVRYIAVNDNVDTKYENSNELMPFKNLFNEWHVRDCSRKVRNVVNAKAQRGIRVGTRAPYGYRKGATKDSPLLVDTCRCASASSSAPRGC